jgi:nucleoside-diphosphate-sugar epimerase
VRVAVIGGSGFIGHHVTGWLVKAGADVTVIHRGQTAVRVPGARSLRADRKHTSALATALAAAAPSVVVDMTAYTGDDVERLLAALPASLTRLVVISSGDVYWTYAAFLGLSSARTTAVPLDEQASLREQLYPYRAQASGQEDLRYGYDKIVVERMAQGGARVPVTILRLPMVYGPNDPQKRIGSYLERLSASGGTLRVNAAEAAWRCTRGYVEDVAWAIRLAALDERAAGEIFNVGEGEALTELEWIRAMGVAAGWSGQVVSDPATPSSLPAEWGTPLVVDTRRIREVLGYREPIGRQEGLRSTIAAEQPGVWPGGAA